MEGTVKWRSLESQGPLYIITYTRVLLDQVTTLYILIYILHFTIYIVHAMGSDSKSLPRIFTMYTV